jgi:hypothetical protein
VKNFLHSHEQPMPVFTGCFESLTGQRLYYFFPHVVPGGAAGHDVELLIETLRPAGEAMAVRAEDLPYVAGGGGG